MPKSELLEKKYAVIAVDGVSIAPALAADREQYLFRKCFSGGEEQ
jgi:hypothetical protein